MTPSRIASVALSAVFALGCARTPIYIQQPAQASQTQLNKDFLECRNAILETAKFANYLHPRLIACLRKNDKEACGEVNGFLTIGASTNYVPHDKALECIRARNLGGFDLNAIHESNKKGVEVSTMLKEFAKKHLR